MTFSNSTLSDPTPQIITQTQSLFPSLPTATIFLSQWRLENSGQKNWSWILENGTLLFGTWQYSRWCWCLPVWLLEHWSLQLQPLSSVHGWLPFHYLLHRYNTKLAFSFILGLDLDLDTVWLFSSNWDISPGSSWPEEAIDNKSELACNVWCMRCNKDVRKCSVGWCVVVIQPLYSRILVPLAWNTKQARLVKQYNFKKK